MACLPNRRHRKYFFIRENKNIISFAYQTNILQENEGGILQSWRKLGNTWHKALHSPPNRFQNKYTEGEEIDLAHRKAHHSAMAKAKLRAHGFFGLFECVQCCRKDEARDEGEGNCCCLPFPFLFDLLFITSIVWNSSLILNFCANLSLFLRQLQKYTKLSWKLERFVCSCNINYLI